MISEEIRFEIDKSQALYSVIKISFVGHSLGGLVIRAALEYLEDFKEHFYTIMTLATPHLGYMHSNSRLLSIGMWAFSRVSKNPTISEMRLSDATNIKQCCLYKLSEKPGLNWFKNVIVMGSSQDSYSPIESALIKLSERMQTHKSYDEYKTM